MKTNERLKTIWFVAAAALSGLCAGFAFWMNLPPQVSGFELVGKPFFENFVGSEQAAALEISAVDENARLHQFAVKKSDGFWRIPSHHNYPAEAAERLAKTSASILGMTRDALAGRLEMDHARYGVLDPLESPVVDPKDVGKRLVLKGDGGQVLADLIVGHEVEMDALPGTEDPLSIQRDRRWFYVRRSDEMQTYRVALDLDLSTRFSDWINTRLLPVEMNDIESVTVNNYELRERPDPTGQRIEIVQLQGDVSKLIRSPQTRTWEMVGLEDPQLTLDANRVGQIVRAIADLRIVGVRPKFRIENDQFLTAELQPKRIPELVAKPEQFAQAVALLSRNLREKGFNLIPRSAALDDFAFVSEFGELSFATASGIEYRLFLGRNIDGDESIIEIGPSTESVGSEPDGESAADSESGADSASQPAPPADQPSSKNRFLMITVRFDEASLEPLPTEPEAPVEPVKPDGYVAAAAADSNEKGAAEGETGQDDSSETKQDLRDPKFVEYDKALAEFQQAQMAYEVAKMRYQAEADERKAQIESAQKTVDELNARFGEWYYVVSAQNLDALRVTRSELLKAATQPPSFGNNPPLQLPPRPDINFPDQLNEKEEARDNDGD